MKNIIVFTDGSCFNNGKKNAFGGIGIHFPNGELQDLSKVYKQGTCTNQKTELLAILTAIRYIRQEIGLNKVKIIIKTDSEYSINCITKWINGWIKNGWITKNNTQVLNKDIILLIHQYYQKYNIELIHVDAHTGNNDPDSIANEIADRLANKAAMRSKNNKIVNNDNKITVELIKKNR